MVHPPRTDAAVAAIRDRQLVFDQEDVAALAARAQCVRAQRRPSVVEWCALAAAMTERLRGVRLHEGQLAAAAAMCDSLTVQMLTGEGKTFAAIAPAAFFAAHGRAVHVATANPYLAVRDADWSGGVLRALGFSTGVTTSSGSRVEKSRVYEADVVYGSANDFGFDFLRDNLFLTDDQLVQRSLDVVIVDEVDAVLLDESRTPLVLSGPTSAGAEPIRTAEAICRMLRLGEDVSIDDVHRRLDLTEAGIAIVEDHLGIANLFDPGAQDRPHLIDNALRARALLRRNRDYVVVDGRVEVVDETTGRIVDGRRWSDGLHQAVEAKEGVEVTAPRRAVGRVTVGGYFSRYRTRVGMSGTLDGADEELSAAFGMQSVAVAPHKPVIRVDHPDVECPDRSAQIAAIVDDTVGRHGRGQPVLIGTTSIGATREVSAALTAVGVAHRTLSAVNDAEEAAVIAEAGRLGAVTVATQMAGRGVDIVLGGAAGERERSRVRDLGGLMVWGLEHHRAARLDRQLAGRSGRQGDPGESRFATSPADELAVLDESGHSAGAAKRGQAVAERLDAELRADVRKIETVVDRLQDHLYAWREKAAAPAKAAEEIPAAVEALAREILESGNWPHGLAPRSLGLFRRRRQVRDHVMRSLDARRSDLGSDLFDRVASLVLKSLLAILWPDTLDQLGAKRSLLNLGAGFPGQLESWQATAVTTYDSFVRSVQAEWIRQVLGARVGDASLEPKPSDRAAWVPPAPSAVPPSDEPLLHEWEGWSFNRFVRQHFGSTVPDPPVVLAIDNVGDSPSAHGLRLHLDLEDARLTVVSLTSAPSGARDGADRGRGTAT